MSLWKKSNEKELNKRAGDGVFTTLVFYQVTSDSGKVYEPFYAIGTYTKGIGWMLRGTFNGKVNVIAYYTSLPRYPEEDNYYEKGMPEQTEE